MFINKQFVLWLILFWFVYNQNAITDQCPTVDMIKERKISRKYEWWIDERRDLDDVLTVEKLYSVRIKEQDKYVACYYSARGLIIQLDAAPAESECGVIEYKGQWDTVNDAERVCNEEDPFACQFAIYCDKTTKEE